MPKYAFAIILAAVATIAGVAALLIQRGHPYISIAAYSGCAILFVFALLAAQRATLPRPRITVIGFDRLDSREGLIVENEADPAYNIKAPRPVPLRQSMVNFHDLPLTRLAKSNGRQCFVVEVQDPSGKRTFNSLYGDMAARGIKEIPVEFDYADGKNPDSRRYTTLGKIQINKGKIWAEFIGQRVRWWPLW